MLGLDGLLATLLPEGREDVPWGTVAAILSIARLCGPSSELHIEEKWYRRTALEDLLGVTPEKVHTDRMYAALDRLLPHKEAIESHLKQRFGELFELRCDLLLHDVTSTYFEGDVEHCAIAKRGYSRHSRGDRPQIYRWHAQGDAAGIRTGTGRTELGGRPREPPSRADFAMRRLPASGWAD